MYSATVNVNGQTVTVIGEDAQDLANGVRNACEVIEAIQEQGKTIEAIVGMGGEDMPTIVAGITSKEVEKPRDIEDIGMEIIASLLSMGYDEEDDDPWGIDPYTHCPRGGCRDNY